MKSTISSFLLLFLVVNECISKVHNPLIQKWVIEAMKEIGKKTSCYKTMCALGKAFLQNDEKFIDFENEIIEIASITMYERTKLNQIQMLYNKPYYLLKYNKLFVKQMNELAKFKIEFEKDDNKNDVFLIITDTSKGNDHYFYVYIFEDKVVLIQSFQNIYILSVSVN